MTEETKMMDAPAAAAAAATYLSQMMPQADGILLEEVEKLSEGDSQHWLITLSFFLNMSGAPAFRTLSPFQLGMGKREYKSFKIDAATGEVVSMKIKAF
ncbi:MAG: hypothetical protein ACTFAL_13225 [Candidatus Electronema sp. V4]|uniref:hypothetical protein n=1 Tax=Candidatus Electronema sp. V4 TaxID=3454756 RepID=UPI0040554F30